jgi:transposase-like protein
MQVARRNRSWTPELKATFVREVTQYTDDGQTRTYAFTKLSNQYGLSPATLSTMYYKIIHRDKVRAAKGGSTPKGATMGFLVPNGKRSAPTDITSAIAALKKMGANVTISF